MIHDSDEDYPPVIIHPQALQTLIDIFEAPTPTPTDTIERIMYMAGRQSVLDYLKRSNKHHVQPQDSIGSSSPASPAPGRPEARPST